MFRVDDDSVIKTIPLQVSLSNNINWPPPYKIKSSRRSKNVSFKISPENGLEVIVPAKFKQIDVIPLLNEQRNWIEKHLTLANEKKLLSTDNYLPRTLALTALDEYWHIIYLHREIAYPRIKIISRQTLCIEGPINHPKQVQQLLIKWLKGYAKEKLELWLEHLSWATGMHFNEMQIRGQKTMWGSCNERKDISLNYKLLFLPASLTRHVLLHELCHLAYLNHSPEFWSLLSQYDSATALNRKALKKADAYVPFWLRHVHG